MEQDFSQALYAMASESVAENYNHFLQELKQETKGHLFTEIPAGGFEAQYIQLLTDSISYFIGKKCHLPDEEIQLSDGMATAGCTSGYGSNRPFQRYPVRSRTEHQDYQS